MIVKMEVVPGFVLQHLATEIIANSVTPKNRAFGSRNPAESQRDHMYQLGYVKALQDVHEFLSGLNNIEHVTEENND